GRAPEMSVHELPPSSVRKTWPGWVPEPFHPEKTAIAFPPSAGWVVTHVAARLGSAGLSGSGAWVVSVHEAPSSAVTQTFPFSVVAQSVPETPPFGALCTLSTVSYVVPARSGLIRVQVEPVGAEPFLYTYLEAVYRIDGVLASSVIGAMKAVCPS